MLSVVIPTKNAGQTLLPVLSALVPAAADGVVREVVLVDGGSQDRTLAIADEAGCKVIRGYEGDDALIAGARAARRGDWLLFLEQDVLLEHGWHLDVAAFIDRQDALGRPVPAAAVHRFAIEDEGVGARLCEAWLTLRSRLFGWAAPEQAVVIARRHFEKIAADRGRIRIGRARLRELRSGAFTTVDRRRERAALHGAL
ncbi:MAG: glycosyltransferase [Hyphomicrobiaceae bacterium]|nr:glycosyltransferase [Hyphomicrobiaceae bacterium]